jgi:pyruvate-ferredoxin/flavodoxin oxidoreductase
MTKTVTIDGNEAVCHVAYKLNEVIAIYPITPSSSMSEGADLLASQGKPNLWGQTPTVVEMQSEGGAAGAVHGALQTGSLATTFTSSQGLLLMIPNMYKIAGELTATVFHIAARSLAAQGLSIFNDHQDVMAVRQTGWAILSSNSVQEAMDMACIAQAATLRSRVPFVHFFDGFRTSHEINKVEMVPDEVLSAMMDGDLINEHRRRGLSPDNPFIRGTAQNPDVYFQARETVNPYYLKVPEILQGEMDRYAELTGRSYKLYEYEGHPEAEQVLVLMGSGAESSADVSNLLQKQGAKTGVLKVRMFRPFATSLFLRALPATTQTLVVLDKTKEPGSAGEPLYQDVVTALMEAQADGTLPFLKMPKVLGGRYGLSSKEFNAGMIKALFEGAAQGTLRNHFTIGINDDVTHTSVPFDPSFSVEDPGAVRAVFWGLGGDGTVSANKNAIKIIGEGTDNHAQGFFYYDSKKAGAITISHLRFGKQKIRAPYLITKANFVACHDYTFMEKVDVLKYAEEGATFLLNSPFPAEEVWNDLPMEAQDQIIRKQLKFFVLDGYAVARQVGLGRRFNIPLQTAFFALSNVLPREEAIAHIKKYIEKSWTRKGQDVVDMNKAAVDVALDSLKQVTYPAVVTSTKRMKPSVSADAPSFVQKITAMMIKGDGDLLPVSALPADGTYPSGTTQYEKRNIALEMPVWDEELCIQCGKCVFICPHACIRGKLYDPAMLEGAPGDWQYAKSMFPTHKDKLYTLTVSPEDCTGCTLCVQMCPVKSKTDPEHRAINMVAQPPIREREVQKWDYFEKLPDAASYELELKSVKNVQLRDPLFEFSGACAGCGETPYLKLLTQLYGERAVVANATGCSSIYGGNLPTTPWAKSTRGLGPAWSNSLFEDAAEFGFGMTLSYQKKTGYARDLAQSLRGELGPELVDEVLGAPQDTEALIEAQRSRVGKLVEVLETLPETPQIKDLKHLAENLVRKSLWIVGGDGWAYDIGYGGLDHVLASGENVNILILDTEVYSNTGGQMSKSTPFGAMAKFAAGGKAKPKKDLALIAMAYQHVYVAQVAMGANDAQTLKAFLEAEAYDGPSLIIAYSPCIEHGYDLSKNVSHQKSAVESGYWPLYRFDPRQVALGKNPFSLDSKKPTMALKDYLAIENRFASLTRSESGESAELLALAQKRIDERWASLERRAQEVVAAPAAV